MSNVTLDSLRKTHGGNAERVFKEIVSLGGYGDVNPNYRGGLDTTSQSLKEGQDHAASQHGLTVEQAVRSGLAVSDDNIKRIEDIVAGDRVK